MKTVVTTPEVDFSLQTLRPERASQVRAWIDRLPGWDADPDLRARASLLADLPGVYYLRTNTDLRLFFRMDGDTITVLDVATRQAILAMSPP